MQILHDLLKKRYRVEPPLDNVSGAEYAPLQPHHAVHEVTKGIQKSEAILGRAHIAVRDVVYVLNCHSMVFWTEKKTWGEVGGGAKTNELK